MTMTEKQLTSTSKLMSLVLRHNPGKIGITLDKNGWASTQALIEGINRAGHTIDLEWLKYVVQNNDKQRFKFNEDYSLIRASQGHSVAVDVELVATRPPATLYHGTATRFLASINKSGLIAKKRLHVHLSSDKLTAEQVGGRHGQAVVLIINAAQMHSDGFKFYLSDNGVWLTQAVPAQYITQ